MSLEAIAVRYPPAPRTTRLRTIDEPPLAFRDERLARSLGRLVQDGAGDELALLVDRDGLVVGASSEGDHDELAAIGAHAMLLADRMAPAYGEVASFALQLRDGRRIEVRDIGFLGCHLVKVGGRPLDALPFDRVARELRLTLGH
ncbi:MAG: hypothetical protein U1F43_27330 [Myxococcota bacterium]